MVTIENGTTRVRASSPNHKNCPEKRSSNINAFYKFSPLSLSLRNISPTHPVNHHHNHPVLGRRKSSSWGNSGWRIHLQRLWLYFKTRTNRRTRLLLLFGCPLLCYLCLLKRAGVSLTATTTTKAKTSSWYSSSLRPNDSSSSAWRLGRKKNPHVDMSRQHTQTRPDIFHPRYMSCFFHDNESTGESYITSTRRLDLTTEHYPSKRQMHVPQSELDSFETIRDNSKKYRRGKADAFETDECTAQHEWQTETHPTCNALHENNLAELQQERVRLISNGFWRDVWAVKHPHDASKMVVKTIRLAHDFEDRNYERHRRDALAMERLTSSPHVVDIYGFCGNSGIFEHADGGDINDALWPRHGDTQLSKLDKLHIATQVSIGIADMHNIDKEGQASMAHTDITTGQFILIDGFFKLNDFNRCRFIGWNKKENKPCGYYVGKNPGKFRSPEEYKYEEQSEKVDIYSMGNVFYALLTERWPFEGMKERETQYKIMDGERPHISSRFRNSSDPLDQVLLKAIEMCWIHDPKKRATAREVANYLATELKKLDPDLPNT